MRFSQTKEKRLLQLFSAVEIIGNGQCFIRTSGASYCRIIEIALLCHCPTTTYLFVLRNITTHFKFILATVEIDVILILAILADDLMVMVMPIA